MGLGPGGFSPVGVGLGGLDLGARGPSARGPPDPQARQERGPEAVAGKLGPEEGVIHQVEMAVEVGPFHQGQQLGGSAVQQAAVGIAAQHHPQAEPAGAAGHQQGFRESAAFEQFDVDAIHHRGQAQQVGQIPTALIGHQGQGRQAG